MTRFDYFLSSIVLSLMSCSSPEPCTPYAGCLDSEICNSQGICIPQAIQDNDDAGNEAPMEENGLIIGGSERDEMSAGEQGGEISAGEQGGEISAGEQGGEISAGEQGGEISAGEQGGIEIPEPLEGCDHGLCLEQVRITNDDNQDGLLSPGERAVLNYFVLRNTGAEDLRGLTGVISSNSPFLSFITDRLSFTPGSDHYYISADDNGDNSDRRCPVQNDCGQATAIRFELSLDTPVDEVITIQFDLSDELSNEYHLEYSLQITPHNVGLELAEIIISDDQNGDGVLSPGESARISYFAMQNIGQADIVGLQGVVSSPSPYLSFTSERLSFTPGSDYSYSAEEARDNSDGQCPLAGNCGQVSSFEFEISPNTPVDTELPIVFDLLDRFNNEYHLEYRLRVEALDVNLEILEVVITGDQATDGLSPGESATLNYFSIRNTGSANLVGLSGSLSSDDPSLIFISERLVFTPGSEHNYTSESDNQDNNDGVCPANSSCGQATDIRFRINEGAISGRVAHLLFTLTDSLDHSYELSYPIEIQ